MDPDYVESVWWSLKQIFDKGLLVQDHRVAPYCPRCGTGLSDHELAQGYETVVDPSVYVRFPLTGGPLADESAPAHLLVWTTTPWTLVSNTAVAVQPDVDLRGRAHRRRRGCSSSPSRCWREVFGEDARGARTLAGRRARARRYARPFDLVDIPEDAAHYVGARRLRHDRRRHRARAPGARVRRRRPRSLPRVRPAGGQPGAARRPLRARASRWSAACSSRRPTRRSSPT